MDEKYPRVLYSHPRNRGVDWRLVKEYAIGRSATCEVDVFIKTDVELGAVWIGPGFIFASDRLANVLRDVGADVTLRPIGVNGQQFWTVHCTRVEEALDLELSTIRYTGPSRIPEVDHLVWRAEALTFPLFRTPHTAETMWATSALVSAVENQAILGLTFGGAGEVVSA